MNNCPPLHTPRGKTGDCYDLPDPYDLPARTRIVTEGQPCDYLFSVRSGMARVVRPDTKKADRTVGFLFPGDMVGVTCSFVNKCRYSVETLVPSTVCRWPRHCLEEMICEIPTFRRVFLDEISHEMNMLQQRMQLLDLKSAGARLAGFLSLMVRRCAHLAGDEEKSPIGNFPFHDAEIADYLNLSPQSLQRALDGLMLCGVVRRDGPMRIFIEDRTALLRLAQPTA